MEQKASLPHRVSLDERKRLTLTGVLQVDCFDEGQILLETTLGRLEVRGEGLSIQDLSVGGGELVVEGRVNALSYSEPRVSGFSALFGPLFGGGKG